LAVVISGVPHRFLVICAGAGVCSRRHLRRSGQDLGAAAARTSAPVGRELGRPIAIILLAG
jgi:hypothetical protein